MRYVSLPIHLSLLRTHYPKEFFRTPSLPCCVGSATLLPTRLVSRIYRYPIQQPSPSDPTLPSQHRHSPLETLTLSTLNPPPECLLVRLCLCTCLCLCPPGLHLPLSTCNNHCSTHLIHKSTSDTRRLPQHQLFIRQSSIKFTVCLNVCRLPDGRPHRRLWLLIRNSHLSTASPRPCI